jgi:hypothetical protein
MMRKRRADREENNRIEVVVSVTRTPVRKMQKTVTLVTMRKMGMKYRTLEWALG